MLYLNKDKKRTLDWFQARDKVVPLGGTKFGFIRSISLSVGLVSPETQYQPRDEPKHTPAAGERDTWCVYQRRRDGVAKGLRNDLKKLDAIGPNKQIIRELMFKKGRTSE